MTGNRAEMRRARPLLGTFVEIAVAGAPPGALEAAVDAAFDAVAAVHRLMSFHEPDSDVGRLNRDAAARAVTVHGWTYEVLAAAVDLHRRSGGTFDIAVAPALRRLGLLPDPPDLDPSPSAAHDLIRLLPRSQIRFAGPGTIDLGGIAKGFAVDRAVEALQRHGIPDGLVNAGGDLRAFGRSYVVDIRDPRQPGHTLFRIALADSALASSAGRFDPALSGEALATAVIDPLTAMPARAVSGATVRAASCMMADALTKVVMNAGEAAGTVLEYYGADALFVTSRGEALMTANWKNEVHLAA